MLEAEMRLSLAAGAAALALSSATPSGVNAQLMEESDIAIGVGIICNTPEQMERLIGLRNDGKALHRAVVAVNDEAKDSRACGVAAVAFMSDKMIDMKNVQGKLVQIVQISVVATFDGRQWARVPIMTQYALIEPKGYTI